MSTTAFAAQSQPISQAAINAAGLELTVLDLEGAACGGAKVQVSGENFQIGRTTDQAGRIHFALPPGTYQLTINFPGFETYQERIEIRDHEILNLSAVLQVLALQGAIVEVPAPEIPIIKLDQQLTLEPAPVQERRVSKPSLFRRVLHKLFQH